MKNELASHSNQAVEDVVVSYKLFSEHFQKISLLLAGLTSVILAASMIPLIIRHPRVWEDGFLLFVFAIPLLIPAIFFLFVKTSKGEVIRLTPGGIEFSGGQKLALLNRTQRQWSDVHSVQISYPESAGRSNRPYFKGERQPLSELLISGGIGPNLSIDFISGGSATIILSYLTRSQAEELFGAIEKFGEPSRFTSDFVKMQKAIILERIDAQSFTQIWGESLSPRYCSTAYEPLPTNHLLQDGRYKVLMELGAGGMSAVYLAKADGVKVVLKESVLPHDIGEKQQEKARELFEREARMLLKLKHAKIARVLDRFVEVERDYLVLEYIPGLTLNQLVKAKGKQKEKDVLGWGRQLAEILVYLHGQEPPLLHRDLTPENVIIKEDRSIVLIDFGAANEFVGQATGTMIGKQCYIAPEQLRGKASQASDLYALGATMFYLLTGEDPEALSCSHPAEKNQAVSAAADNLVARLTAFDCQDRPNSAASALEDFDQVGTTCDTNSSKRRL